MTWCHMQAVMTEFPSELIRHAQDQETGCPEIIHCFRGTESVLKACFSTSRINSCCPSVKVHKRFIRYPHIFANHARQAPAQISTARLAISDLNKIGPRSWNTFHLALWDITLMVLSRPLWEGLVFSLSLLARNPQQDILGRACLLSRAHTCGQKLVRFLFRWFSPMNLKIQNLRKDQICVDESVNVGKLALTAHPTIHRKLWSSKEDMCVPVEKNVMLLYSSVKMSLQIVRSIPPFSALSFKGADFNPCLHLHTSIHTLCREILTP